MSSVDFNISIKLSDERAKQIQEETNCTIKEYYEILLKDNLENVLPKGDDEKLELTFEGSEEPVMENNNE